MEAGHHGGEELLTSGNRDAGAGDRDDLQRPIPSRPHLLTCPPPSKITPPAGDQPSTHASPNHHTGPLCVWVWKGRSWPLGKWLARGRNWVLPSLWLSSVGGITGLGFSVSGCALWGTTDAGKIQPLGHALQCIPFQHFHSTGCWKLVYTELTQKCTCLWVVVRSCFCEDDSWHPLFCHLADIILSSLLILPFHIPFSKVPVITATFL